MITELREVMMNTPEIRRPEPLLSIQDLHVWYELRKFGFGHAGYVKAVDGVSFVLEEGETVAVVGEFRMRKIKPDEDDPGVEHSHPLARSSLTLRIYPN